MDSEYKEGREYIFSEFINDGSYGEVYSAQDVNTGFKFAVKKVKQNLAPCHIFQRSPCLPILFVILADRQEEVHQWGGGCVEYPQISSCGGTLWGGQGGPLRVTVHGPESG